MGKLTIDSAVKTKLIAILNALFPEAKIYLFGSFATGESRPYSDVDIALDAGQKIDLRRLGEAMSMLRESSIPYTIDLVDVHRLPEEMRAQISKEWIAWKS